MDHEGEEGAGAEPVDVLEEAQLARLEAAGAPPRLPKQYRHLWLAHAEVPEAKQHTMGGPHGWKGVRGGVISYPLSSSPLHILQHNLAHLSVILAPRMYSV